MPKKEYDWTNGPATLEPHSRAKHTILRRYVEEYLELLFDAFEPGKRGPAESNTSKGVAG